MTQPHEVYSFDGVLMSAIGVVSAMISAESDDPTSDQQYLDRSGGTGLYTASIVPSHEIVAVFPCGVTYATIENVVRLLDWPTNDDERDLTIYVGDPANLTLATGRVTVISVVVFAGQVTARLSLADPVWRAVATVTEGPHTFAVSGAIALENTGHARAYPEITLTPTAAKTSGWLYQRDVTITNNGTRDWLRRSVTVSMGDTTALVSGGKALSSGNDVIVVCEGRVYPRELINWNVTGNTYITFVVTIPAPRLPDTVTSRTFEIWYGNAAATAPLDLSTRGGTRDTYVAPDYGSIAAVNATTFTTTTIGDSSLAMEVDRFAGGFLIISSGTGSGQRRRILSNTATVFTVRRAFTTTPDATSDFVVSMSGIFVDGGRATTGGTTTLVTDSLQSLVPDALVDGYIWNVTQGTGPFVITANTDTTVTSAAFGAVWATNDVYYIYRQGFLKWMTRSAIYESDWRGLWRLNNWHSEPEDTFEFGSRTPDAWTPTTYLRNGDNFAQSSFASYGAGGGHDENWRALLRSRRRVRQDAKFAEQGNADGVAFYHPWGIQAFTFDYNLLNESGVGKFVTAVQGEGGVPWSDVFTDSTTQVTLTNMGVQSPDLSVYDRPIVRIYQGGLPADGVEIVSTAAKNHDLEVRSGVTMEVYLRLDDVSGLSATQGIFVTGNETAIYDMNQYIRLGGGTDANDEAVGPSDDILIGEQAGDGHKIGIPLNHSLIIRTDPSTTQPLIGHYNGSTLVRRASWAALIKRITPDVDNALIPIISREFLPVLPAANKVSNGTFDTALTDWTANGTIGTVTLSWTQQGATVYEGAGAARCQVTANTTAGANVFITRLINTPPPATGGRSPVVPGKVYEAAAFVRTTDIDLNPRLAIGWYDASDVLISYSTSPDWVAPIDVWHPHGVGAIAPATAAYARVVPEVYSDGTGNTGSCYFDSVVGGVANLWINEENLGTMSVTASIVRGYLG